MVDSKPRRAREVSPSGGSFLIIDADENSRQAIESVVRETNPELVSGLDSAHALYRFLDSQPWNWTPSIIFVDLVLPAISGYDVIRRLRDRYGKRRIPIIVVSALGTMEDMLEAQVAGATAFIRKPYRAEQIAKAVDYCLLEASKPAGERKGSIQLIS